jgi:hypothetical protein
MTDGFDLGGALDGAFTSFVPVGDRLLRQSCFSVVMRQQFWLGLSGLWELGFQDLGNPLVVVLSRAL